jgi:selenide,water dikinase
MIKASDVDASLHLLQVPLLEGLTQSMAAGIFSSLQPQNVRLRRAISNLETAATHPLYPILFDPQTAGGLLASIPTERAQACVDALRKAGYASAAIVGRVKPRSLSLAAVTLELKQGGSGLDHRRNIPEAREPPTEGMPQAQQSAGY